MQSKKSITVKQGSMSLDSEQTENTEIADDYSESPICDERAIDNVIECEDCSLWFHYVCVGLSAEDARKIPEINPYICVNCNNHKLYSDFLTEITVSEKSQVTVAANTIPGDAAEKEKNNPSNINATGIKKLKELNEVNDNQVNSEIFLNQDKNSCVGKVGKKNSNNNVQQKRKLGSDSNEIEQKTLINQLERQIREEDKTLILLTKVRTQTGQKI